MGKNKSRSYDDRAKKALDKKPARRSQKDPDPASSSYYYDEVDQHMMEKEKVLLDSQAEKRRTKKGIAEVLAFDDDDSDSEDEMISRYKQQLKYYQREQFKEAIISDLEDNVDEDDREDTKKKKKKQSSFGTKKQNFYGADNVGRLVTDQDYEELEAEEQEALDIQNRMTADLDEEDFGLDIFEGIEEEAADSEATATVKPTVIEKTVKTDLSKMNKKQQLQLLNRQSPELLELISDYKQKMNIVKNELCPLVELIKCSKIPQSTGSKYITTKLHLYLNYCVNITFYMKLKAAQTSVQNHPIIKRLLQYRNIIKQLDEADAQLQPDIDDLLERYHAGEFDEKKKTKKNKRVLAQMEVESSKSKKKSKAKKSVEPAEAIDSDSDDSIDVKVQTPASNQMSKVKKLQKSLGEMAGVVVQSDDEGLEQSDYNMIGDGDGGEGGKRGISKEISKNKGLTKKGKKENNNPRVKLKRKYNDALKRKGHKMQVKKTTYGGEAKGVQAGRVASKKF